MAGLPPHASEAEIVKFIGSHYGADIAAFLRIPELRKIIINAAQQDWNEQLVSTNLRRSPWYRARSESMRTIDALRVADPKQYNALVEKYQASIRGQMISLGLSGSRGTAEIFLRLGFDENQVRENFANSLDRVSAGTGLQVGSQPEAAADELMMIARSEYLTPIDRQTAEKWAIRGFRTGEDIEAAFRSYMGTIAGTRFGIAPDSGITPSDVLSPVRMAIAEQLEIDPKTVDFLDHKYSDVLQIETKDGKFRPMTAHEASVWARSKDEFKTTQKAEDDTAAVVETLGKTFGKVA